MSRAGKVKIGSHWKKPPTKIYDYNYNFQEGYYKPMVEHLEKKDRGISGEPPPGAQTFAERVATKCPGCLATHEPTKVHFGPGVQGQPDYLHDHPPHHHHHHHPSSPDEEGGDRPSRRRPRGDDEDSGLPSDAGRGPRSRLNLQMPNLDMGDLGDDMLSPSSPVEGRRRRPRRGLKSHGDFDDLDMEDPFGKKGGENLDSMMKDLGLENPFGRRGKGNRTPQDEDEGLFGQRSGAFKGNLSQDALLESGIGRRGGRGTRSSQLMEELTLSTTKSRNPAARGYLGLDEDESSSLLDSSLNVRKRSYNLSAVSEKSSISSSKAF